MDRKYLAILWGGRVSSEDGWSGRLQGAYMAPRSQQISHILIKRSIFGRPKPLKLENAQQEADGTLILPSQQQGNAAPAKGSVSFTSKTVVNYSSGASLPLRGVILNREHLRMEYILSGTGREARAIPMNLVDKLASGSPSVSLEKAMLETLSIFKPDVEAHRNAQAALEKADPTEDIFHYVQVQAVDGTAYLTGNVRLPVHKEDAGRAAASAMGVLTLQNSIVTDWELDISIADALAREGLMRQGVVTLKSSLGRIRLSGHLTTKELVYKAITVATGIAGVHAVEHDIQVRPMPTLEPATVAETDIETANH